MIHAIRRITFILYACVVLVILSCLSFRCNGFTIRQSFTIGRRGSLMPSTTSLNLEDWVAAMIDHELYRQNHRKEYQEEWMEKNKGAVLRSLNVDGDTSATTMTTIPSTASVIPDEENFRQIVKDRRMAKLNPQQYCADRCVATGNCDVYEDLFNFSPEEVMAFCNDCVLADDDVEHDHCDIPEAFYDITDSQSLKP